MFIKSLKLHPSLWVWKLPDTQYVSNTFPLSHRRKMQLNFNTWAIYNRICVFSKRIDNACENSFFVHKNVFFESLMYILKREISLSASKEIGKLRLYVALFPKFLPWEGNKNSQPHDFSLNKCFGFKRRQAMFQEKSLVLDPLPATSILRFCSTCPFLQQTNPGTQYDCVRMWLARSVTQVFIKPLLVSHFLISYWPKQIT